MEMKCRNKRAVEPGHLRNLLIEIDWDPVEMIENFLGLFLIRVVS